MVSRTRGPQSFRALIRFSRPIGTASPKLQEYFNVDAFTYPTVGTFSPVGRNAFIGPGYIMTNMTIGRDFPMSQWREGMRLNLRVEGYNVFNTPNLGQPQSQFSCSTTSTKGGSCTAAGGSYPAHRRFDDIRRELRQHP